MSEGNNGKNLILMLCAFILALAFLFTTNNIKLSYVTNLPKDDLTGSLETIDYAHHEIHEGNHYFISHLHTITSNKSILIRNNQSDKTIHLIYSLASNAEADIKLYEAVNITSSGTQWNISNNNRNYPDNDSVLYVSDGTVTFTGGEILLNDFVGANKNSGSISRENELILKNNTDYVFVVDPQVPSVKLSCLFEWYEK